MEQRIEYPGCAIHERLTNGRAGGRIVYTGYSLRFESDQGGIEFSFQGLIIKRGGSSGHLIFFEHPAHPGWTIYTEKKSILRKIKRSRVEDVNRQIAGITRATVKIRAIIVIIILAIAAFFYGLYLLRTPVARSIAAKIPASWEVELGQTVFNGYKAGKAIIEDTEIVRSLEKLTSPLINSIPGKRYEFHVYIVEDPAINAFALPGGYVVLNTGLIAAVESAEELLGVLAHEIAHATLQHGIRKMLDSMGLMLIVKAMLGDQSGLWGGVVGNGAFLLNQKFSRGFEKEADEMGFGYMVKARIDPRGMIGFFRRLREESKKSGAGELEETLNFLSTHPDPGARIEYLNRELESLGKNISFLNLEADFKAFKDAVRKKE